MKKDSTILLLILFLNLICSIMLPLKPIDIEIARELSQHSFCGLGFYLATLSGQLNCFILLCFIELLSFEFIDDLKQKYYF